LSVFLNLGVIGANCPDGTELLSYSLLTSNLTYSERSGYYIYRAEGEIEVELNCDLDECITQVSASVDVYCDYTLMNGNSEGFDGGGSGQAFPALCDKGDFAIITVTYVDGSVYQPVAAYFYAGSGTDPL
jgi:hypothetical protein